MQLGESIDRSSFIVPLDSHYEAGGQIKHHEIECFFSTTIVVIKNYLISPCVMEFIAGVSRQENVTFRLSLPSDAQYHPFVIRRFYIHNFRSLENFELPVSGHSSILLIGKNGTGKTAIGLALEVLQRIARGTNKVGDLIKSSDFTRERVDVPMRFEIEVDLDAKIYEYVIAFRIQGSAKEPVVLEENLAIDGTPVYSRKQGRMRLAKTNGRQEANFPVNLQLVALPIVQEESRNAPLFIFKEWLARMLILRPIPSLIPGDSEKETLWPNIQVTDFGEWFSGLLAYAPAAYARIDEYLKQVMPDLKDIRNPMVGKDSRSLSVHFSNTQGSLTIPFESLSDGEKCFTICALVLAANYAYGPVLCFWDEPDNYLALDEVGHFVLALRKAFQSGGQFIATSHNPEAISRFSDENTFVLYRDNHLEPTRIKPLNDIQYNGDLISALIRGDIEP